MTMLTHAIVLAAGLGTRMQPITNNLPKPLVQVLRRPLIDYSLERLKSAGVSQVVVNTHYLSEQIEAHLADRREIRVSHEVQRLETGGGVANALHLLGKRAFFVLNSDALWIDGPTPALDRLAAAWNEKKMDALLLLQPTSRLIHYSGIGDFHLSPDNQAYRRTENQVAAFIFAGVQILHPRLFARAPGGPFSLNILYDKAEESGRLFAIVHDGDWYHVGTPEELKVVEESMVRANIATNSR
ncbi:MAG: nucleotidyltransferase family protein [Alphaproteobacteria bacterium]